MRLEEVLPELIGSLTLSELFFRGEGPPWAWNRMDQYHRKMRKPVGSEANGLPDGKTPSGPCSSLRVPLLQGSSQILKALEPLRMTQYTVAYQGFSVGLGSQAS